MNVARAQLLLSLVVLCCAASPPNEPSLRADRIVVEKSARRLTLFSGRRALKSYRVALGPAPLGAKQCEGDGRTPEGVYAIDSRNRQSAYHRALHVSYPEQRDVANARRIGCRPGGAIMIHGLKNGFGSIGAAHANVDWTAGCIAVTNAEIEEIWRAVPNGTEIDIRP